MTAGETLVQEMMQKTFWEREYMQNVFHVSVFHSIIGVSIVDYSGTHHRYCRTPHDE